ncbi:hypothetical protein BDN72DRAFT_389143 [Pluteus cervinus]|uniref:Uncharacterized protein n=1 Tax=Pluteus cervinus TaxID=181527 RepID=A0ACD3B1Y2_9AGAR|nr:hypothetical protein BDN72DRAFT_389143 [Pluteus cervinus]
MGNTPSCVSTAHSHGDQLDEQTTELKKFMKTLDGSMNDSIMKRVKRELEGYDLVLVLDNSSAMKAHWPGVKNALTDLCHIAGYYDTDGFDLCIVSNHLRGSRPQNYTSRQFKDLDESFSSMKFCDARSGLYSALKSLPPFNNSTPRRKLNYIILTAACDQNTYTGLNALVGECVHWIKKHGYPPNQVIPCLHPPRSVDSTSFQIGFQFVQVGSDDQTRTRLKQLDDAHLENDIVDCTQISLSPSNSPEHLLDAAAIVKILLGGIDKRIDEKGAKGLWHVPCLHRNPLTGSSGQEKTVHTIPPELSMRTG